MVTEDRVRWAVNSFMPYKATGPDGIYPICLQKGLDLIIKHLIKVYGGSIAMGHIPEPWRDLRVVLIPKLGKEPTLAKSYRPISLPCFMLKTLERLVDRFLREGTLTRHPLQGTQRAYLQGKSTETALHSLVTKIEYSMQEKQFAMAVFMDIQGAFDSTTFAAIQEPRKAAM